MELSKRAAYQLLVVETTYDGMPSYADQPVATRSRDEIASYLNANPEHAVVVVGRGREPEPVAIFHGAGADSDNYFVAAMPLEDPNDAEGGELSAVKAVDVAAGWTSGTKDDEEWDNEMGE